MLDGPLRDAAEVAGDRWVLLALGALADGSRRFGDLQADLQSGAVGIAPNVLIDRLRRMERDGLVVATPYSQRPRRYVYDLTEAGRELAAILPALSTWASRRSGGGGEPRRHDVCGTPLETRVWCPTCAVAVDTVADAENVRWV
jgi:DNA-binding HxlR family transcriptional regulator